MDRRNPIAQHDRVARGSEGGMTTTAWAVSSTPSHVSGSTLPLGSLATADPRDAREKRSSALVLKPHAVVGPLEAVRRRLTSHESNEMPFQEHIQFCRWDARKRACSFMSRRKIETDYSYSALVFGLPRCRCNAPSLGKSVLGLVASAPTVRPSRSSWGPWLSRRRRRPHGFTWTLLLGRFNTLDGGGAPEP